MPFAVTLGSLQESTQVVLKLVITYAAGRPAVTAMCMKLQLCLCHSTHLRCCPCPASRPAPRPAGHPDHTAQVQDLWVVLNNAQLLLAVSVT